MKPHLGWRWKRIGIARARKGLKGLKGNWGVRAWPVYEII